MSEEVPSRGDRDELGDMARAVQVFKENATELFERKIQLEQVNVQLDLALNNMAHGLCMFDADRNLIICNDRYARMYGVPARLRQSRVRRLWPCCNFWSAMRRLPSTHGGNICCGQDVAGQRQFPVHQVDVRWPS